MTNPKLGVDLAGLDLRTTLQGDLALMCDVENVRAAILRRLDTPIGGLFAHPWYGNPLHDILSEPMDDTWRMKAVTGIHDCLSQEPRIKVEAVVLHIEMESRKAVFEISYVIMDIPGIDNLVWEVNLP